MNKVLLTLGVGSILLFNSINSLAQYPNVDFSLNPSGCKAENIEIENNSTDANYYNWDFCSDDLSSFPTSSIVLNNDDFYRARTFKLIQYNSNWYGFAISSVLNNIMRLDFGESLSNTPVYNNLGTFDGVFNGAYDLDAIEINGIWNIIVSNTGAGNIVRLKFTNGLTDVSPTVENMGNFGVLTNPTHTLTLKENNLIYFLISDNSNLISVSFVDTLDDPGPSVTTNTVIGSLLLRGLTMVKDHDQWKGLILSYNNNSIFTVDFGSSLSNVPTFNLLPTVGLGIHVPTNVQIVNERNNYWAFVIGGGGEFHRFNFGENLTSFAFTADELTIPNVAAENNFALEMTKQNSQWYLFNFNLVQKTFIKLEFENICPATLSESTDVVPHGLSYNEPGLYYVSIEAIDNSGNTNYLTKTISISSSTAPQITSQITGNCLSNPISFDGQQVSGNITDWSWDFGDGVGTSALQNDTYTYASAGTYQVKLNVTDANGCNNLQVDTVQVYEEPIPDFTYPAGSFCMNNSIPFTNTSTGETGPAVNWTWDFNGEGISTDKDASFIFTTSGSKTIELKSSIPGCANVIQKVIFIEEAPTVDFSFDNVCNTQTTSFSDLTSGNNLVSWNWDFGDGGNSTDQNPTHTYADPGQYDVTLIVTNTIGCSTELTQTVYNHNIPTVGFTHDLACSTSPIQFTDQSLVQNANLVAWEWNFGDGNTSSDENPQYVYNQTGDFTVQLKAYSEFGCVDSTKTTLSVIQGPEVDFAWDKSCVDATTLFTDNTNTFGIGVTERAWIIDSNLKTEQNPTYTFDSPGTYPIQLSVTLANLCAQTVTQDIEVKSPPAVQFSYEEGCGGSGTTFYDLTDQTNDPIVAWEWRVDGQMQSTDSAFTTQLAPDTYSISLSVTTEAGCDKSKITDVTLIGSPMADFSVNTDYGATPLHVSFTNSSTGGSSFEWSFGDKDNTTSPEVNPEFTFEETGTYAVTLKTSSGPDCFDETTRTIEVTDPETNAEIVTITPINGTNLTNFIVTIENTGTTTLDNTYNLVFRPDYGTETIEPLNQIIYANKKINYPASFAIPSTSTMESLCVELLDEEGNTLDRNCIVTGNIPLISKPYPNPVKENIFIDVMLSNGSEINVRILNRSGQLQLSKDYTGNIGLNQLEIDTKNLLQGLYIIEISAGGETKQFKTSVVR